MSSLLYNGRPLGYGAIMYNGSSTGITSCYPFFTSQSNLATLISISSSGSGTISVGDVDEYWMVMPGYKLIVYTNTSFVGPILLTGDNTSGSVPVNYPIANPNNASSIQLYFNGTQI
jgi:hypothetical protein